MQKYLCAAGFAAMDSAACDPHLRSPLDSQMASVEHHGCREIGWRKNG
jgi:hypothetical protein